MPKQAKISKRPDGNYCRSIVIGRKSDGKPIRKYIYAKTIKELDVRTAEYARQFKHGTLSADENATFSKVAFIWIDTAKATATERTKKRYISIVEKRFNDISSIKVKDLKPMHLQGIINNMAVNGYSKKTMTEAKQAASAILDFALQNDIVFRNVFSKVTIQDTDAKVREPLTPRQRQIVDSTWNGHRMGVPVLIMMYCGLRRGELIALTWNDMDLKAKTITVNKATAFYGNVGSVKSPKSKAGERVVPIPDIIIPAINSAKTGGSLFVCPAQETGGMMSGTAFKRGWNSYQYYLNIQAGGREASRSNPKVMAIEPFTAHQLRHTYATMLYDAGVDVLTAQKLLGHADVQTTMRIYTHLSEQKENRSIDAFNAFLSGKKLPIEK